MATHSTVLAWKFPWTEEPGRLQSMESQRVRYNWSHTCGILYHIIFNNQFTFLLKSLHWISKSTEQNLNTQSRLGWPLLCPPTSKPQILHSEFLPFPHPTLSQHYILFTHVVPVNSISARALHWSNFPLPSMSSQEVPSSLQTTLKVKALVTQSCPALCNPMDCSPPGRLFCAWDSPGKNTGAGCLSLFQGILPSQGSNLGALHCRQILYHLSHQGNPDPRWPS